jgi:hypothetical protein
MRGTQQISDDNKRGAPCSDDGIFRLIVGMLFAMAAGTAATSVAKADEGGVSFWIPGFFGSLAAAPLQPGWSLTTIEYSDSVHAGGEPQSRIDR